ncbi:MAG: hypothetical protein JKX98_04155, partial [Alcanivoracaceae bacterium]|nr:hypothetical protein [Alcanivoracaceae bacterium]
TDHYDVFLLQVHGQRQWKFSLDKIYKPELMPEQALKLISQFKADETHVLNPGDVLYLPPEIAHYGIATTEDCVTCSIGMRTPSHSELLTAFIDNLAQSISADNRFEEPQFTKQPKAGEITTKDINNIAQILSSNMSLDNSSLTHWFGKYITEYRSIFYEFNQYQDKQKLDYKHDLILSPFSKSCYFKHDNTAQLFVNGLSLQSSLKLAELICDHKHLPIQELKIMSIEEEKIIGELFENGSLIISE